MRVITPVSRLRPGSDLLLLLPPHFLGLSLEGSPQCSAAPSIKDARTTGCGLLIHFRRRAIAGGCGGVFVSLFISFFSRVVVSRIISGSAELDQCLAS